MREVISLNGTLPTRVEPSPLCLLSSDTILHTSQMLISRVNSRPSRLPDRELLLGGEKSSEASYEFESLGLKVSVTDTSFIFTVVLSGAWHSSESAWKRGLPSELTSLL